MNLFEIPPSIGVNETSDLYCTYCNRAARYHVQHYCANCNKPVRQQTQRLITRDTLLEAYDNELLKLSPYKNSRYYIGDPVNENDPTFEFLDYEHVINYMEERVPGITQRLKPFFIHRAQARKGIHIYVNLDYYVGKNFIYTSDSEGSAEAQKDRLRKSDLAKLRAEFDLPSTYMFYFSDTIF